MGRLVGYSLPAYDVAIKSLLARAAGIAGVKRIQIFDPSSETEESLEEFGAGDQCCKSWPFDHWLTKGRALGPDEPRTSRIRLISL